MPTPKRTPSKPKPASPTASLTPTLHNFLTSAPKRPPPPPPTSAKRLGASRLGPAAKVKPKPKSKASPKLKAKGKAKVGGGKGALPVVGGAVEVVELSSGSESEGGEEGRAKRRKVDKGKGRADQDGSVEAMVLSSSPIQLSPAGPTPSLPVVPPPTASNPSPPIAGPSNPAPQRPPAPSSPIQPASSPLANLPATPPAKEEDIDYDSYFDNLDGDGGEESQPPHLLTYGGEGDDSQAMLPPLEMTEEEGQPSKVDEEMLLKEEAVNEVVEGCSKDLEGEEAACPVCGESLEGRTAKGRELHANSCLDDTQPSKPSAFLRFLPKLTSIFRSAPPRPPTPSADDPDAPSFTAPDTKPDLKSDIKPAAAAAGPRIFQKLMQTSVTQKLWEEVDAIEGDATREANKGKRREKGAERKVPFYKWIEGMEITVDAFRYGKIAGCKAYFLSHAHSDHYQEMRKSWNHGPIYCSQTTANLIKIKLGVADEWLKVLPMDQPVWIHGIKVTLIDANHCPGAVLFLFEGQHTDPASPHTGTGREFRYLHCGDFRASPAMLRHPALKGKRIDACYLDTTYLKEIYCVPAQPLVIRACADLVKARVAGDDLALSGKDRGAAEMMKGWLTTAKTEPEASTSTNRSPVSPANGKRKERLLILVGTYSIGKERLAKALAIELGSQIYCDERKRPLILAQDDPELHALLTDDPLAAVHLVNMFDLKIPFMEDTLRRLKKYAETERLVGKSVPDPFTKVVGLRPTGWTYKPEGTRQEKSLSPADLLKRESERGYSSSVMYPTRDSTSTVLSFGVPYSEHSSFGELTAFCVSLDCPRFIPTVNVGNQQSRDMMQGWFDKWDRERARRKAAGLPRVVEARGENYW